MQKYDHISEEIWSPEQLYSASAEDERPDTAAKVGPKLEMHSQNVLKMLKVKTLRGSHVSTKIFYLEFFINEVFSVEKF